MTEQEKLMYEILGQISNTDIPIVFKGGLITKLILGENGFNDIQRATKDIDANWTGEPPTMENLVNAINQGFGDLQKSYIAIASRPYKEKQSAGISIIDKNTNRKIITMDIDIKPLIESKYYYYEQTKIKGVLPNEILADKICVLSSEAIYKNRAKDILDVFLLSQCVYVYSKEITNVCEKTGRSIQSFDAFKNKKTETEHAYNKLKGIEGKPEFNLVYTYLSHFILPFVQKDIPNKLWNSEKLYWSDVSRTKGIISKSQIKQNAKLIADRHSKNNIKKKEHNL